MENAQRYRALALLCRQQAVLHPEAGWQWLAEAETYEHLATADVAKECSEGRELEAKAA